MSSPTTSFSDSPLQKFMWKLQGLSDDTMNDNLGKVLTLIDASITDKEQNKALKDLIKQVFYDSELEAHRRRTALVGKFIKVNKLPIKLEDYMEQAMKEYHAEDNNVPSYAFLDLEN
jgi:hypothetical protein